jgi:hypothetical protein
LGPSFQRFLWFIYLSQTLSVWWISHPNFELTSLIHLFNCLLFEVIDNFYETFQFASISNTLIPLDTQIELWTFEGVVLPCFSIFIAFLLCHFHICCDGYLSVLYESLLNDQPSLEVSSLLPLRGEKADLSNNKTTQNQSHI